MGVAVPPSLRGGLRRPVGPVYPDVEPLRAVLGAPLHTVGDVVTATLTDAARPPQVAIVDGRTGRAPTRPDVAAVVAARRRTRHVRNPAGQITTAAVAAVGEALAAGAEQTIWVSGEADLLVIPLAIAAPTGTSIVYGQPGEGMVHVAVTPAVTEAMEAVLRRCTGGVDELLQMLQTAE
ncbi:UNVERIFIED_CONTAM: hypothetical protein BEN50_19860 [Euhalothece sp. KZN 001]